MKSSKTSAKTVLNQISGIRFVKLQMAASGDSYFNISQITCLDKFGANVTRGKTVTVSSGSDYGQNPQSLTDGNEIPRPHPQSYHLRFQNNEWAKIDLGGNYDIQSCTIYNRSDCCQFRIKNAVLSLLDANNFQKSSFTITSTDNVIPVNFTVGAINPEDLTRYVVYFAATNNSDRSINLSQIACFEGTLNVCKNKPVSALTVYRDGGNNPNTLTDGNLRARNYPEIFHSNQGSGDWVVIDLGQPYFITKVTVWNRLDCCQFRTKDASIVLRNSSHRDINSKVITETSNSFSVYFAFYTRYVHLTTPMNGDNAINLSQIACFDFSGNNVTLNKPVQSSSIAFDKDPNLLTDGRNRASSWGEGNVFHSSRNGGDTILIDLQGPYKIRSCKIYNRTDCCQHRILNSVLSLVGENDIEITSRRITSQANEIDVNFG